MTKDTTHAFKIASFNALGYCMATGVPTYVDPMLKSHILYGAQQHPLGYWILLVGLLIFFGNYILITHVSSWKLKVTLPGLMLFIAGIISLSNFFPEFPHVNVLAWTFLFTLTSTASSLFHYFPMRTDYIHDVSIPEAARIERIKESVNLWRTFSIALLVAYFALLIPWFNHFMKSIPMFLKNEQEIRLLKLLVEGEVAMFSIYVIAGPIVDSFRRTTSVADVLLEIKEHMPTKHDKVEDA